MELLLILSALLSALTGAISGVRAPEVRSHQAAVEAGVACSDAPFAAHHAARRIVQSVPTLIAASGFGVRAAFVLDRFMPLYAERRRE